MRPDGNLGSGFPAAAAGHDNWLRRRLAFIPRPLRFIAVGGLGLFADLAIFTAIPMHAHHPLATRLISLACATLLTWRLNRAMTFDASGRKQHDEALRYAAVTAVAQGTSFAIFSLLVLTLLNFFPQGALITGAAVGAAISYAGHALIAFAPVQKVAKTESRA
jgi:putative flippase GtrA